MKEERGSEKMLRQRLESRVISDADIVRFVGLANVKDIVISDWRPRGQPDLDFLAGIIQIPRESVGDVIDTLLDVDVPIELRVLPRGVVALDAVEIQFRTGTA